MKYLLFIILITWCCTIHTQPQPWRNKTPAECEDVFNTAASMFPPLL